MRREEILSTAAELINGDRDRDYGDAHKNFQDVARLWSVILETEITEQQFVLCMIMLKAARLMKTDHEDSWVDLCGYAALGGEKVGVL
tara:strand:- start:2542 stop:2805 length:264 start_codon:yes stop_codon:yes gene_type:complete